MTKKKAKPGRETIKREMRRLRKIIDDPNTAARPRRCLDEAYGMETALQWTLGGCTWRPSTLVRLVNDE